MERAGTVSYTHLDVYKRQEQQLSDARAELDKGWQELSDGQEEFDAEKQQAEDGFAEARDEIAAGKQQIADGSAQLDAAEQQLSLIHIWWIHTATRCSVKISEDNICDSAYDRKDQ